jgi:tRNA modification GTPase
MIRLDLDDTIVALSTARGRAAIGIVRMSGPKSIPIADTIFRSIAGETASTLESHRVRYGEVCEDGKVIDTAMILIMRGPRSYTGEDVVEIHCHGNPLVLEKVVTSCTKAGARPAGPGEFTKRAFLNGKMDLSQAEAVAEVIEAGNERAMALALRHIKGELKAELEELRNGLLSLRAEMEARIEFPEEIDEVSIGDAEYNINMYINVCNTMLINSERYIKIREGIRVVITGKPNAGKSSLFNKLLMCERSIISEEPGTTRDTIEEQVNFHGTAVVIVDTAGICAKKEGPAKKEAVRRSKDQIEKADLVIFVADMSVKWSGIDEEIATLLRGKKGIIAYNKADLDKIIDKKKVPKLIREWKGIETSAIDGVGIKELIDLISIECRIDEILEDNGTAILSNMRQCNALRCCKKYMEEAMQALKTGYSEEIISISLGKALEALEEITGKSAGEDLLDKVFSKFCIGK